MKRRRPQPRGVLARRSPQPVRRPRRRTGTPRTSAKTSRGARKAEGRAASRRRAKFTRTEAKPSVVLAPDGGVLLTTTLLAALGIVMIYSSTAPLDIGQPLPEHWLRHLAVLGVAVAGCVVALRLPLELWRRLAIPLWAGSVLLLAATLVVGVEVKGAQRWLSLPGLPLRFQPAELARFATLLAVAALLARRGASWRGTRWALALSLPPALLLLGQPDFGSAALLLATSAALLFAVGTPLPRLALLGVGGALGAGLYVSLNRYALDRFTGFLDPWATARDEGFQLVQSFIAFARGGSLGVGLGDGRQKLFYLPEAHTDFMLSVVAEELGLVGVLLVLGAFAALALAGLRIALRARDPFVMLVGFGMTLLLTLPAAVNAAVVMGLLPTTGFPLPFLSYGGNSLLFCGLAVGLLLRIGSREARPRPARVGPAATRGLVQ